MTNEKDFGAQRRADYYREALVPISRPAARQVAGWIRTGRFQNVAGTRDYRKALSAVGCPVLFVAGKIDNVVDPTDSIDAFNAVGSPGRQIRIFGKANFHAVDYRHAGLLVGPHTSKDVFPFILKWMADNG